MPAVEPDQGGKGVAINFDHRSAGLTGGPAQAMRNSHVGHARQLAAGFELEGGRKMQGTCEFPCADPGYAGSLINSRLDPTPA